MSNPPAPLLSVALALSSVGLAVAASDEESAEPDWDQKIAVEAELEGMPEGPLGTVSTVVTPDRIPGLPASATDLVVNTPAVSENGQGGHFQVFSIRGVSAQRVLNFVSGMRLYTERRAGVSISFIEPYLLGKVDILRGPATTFLGSGAIGGAVQVTPRKIDGWLVQAGYETAGDQNYQVFGYGSGEWSIGVARRDAANAEAPDGTELNTQFTQYSGVVNWKREAGDKTYELLWIPSRGEEIGKSNTDFPDVRTTNYPLERHQLLRFATTDDDGWKAQLWMHAHDLETEITETEARSFVENDSLDWGFRYEQELELPAETGLTWGADGIGRNGVSARETMVDLSTGETVVTDPLEDARQFEAGLFATGRWQWERVQLQAGARLSWQTQKNDGGSSVDDSAPNAFVGVSWRPVDPLELRGNISSGLRFPSLSELFFTGSTGRGEVIGNPDLDPERSLNAEVALRWTTSRFLLNAGVWNNEIDDYIERDVIATDVLSWVNLPSGTIRGAELQGMWLPSPNWIAGFGGHTMHGRGDDGQRLIDIPQDELWVEGTHRSGRWSIDLRWTHRFEKDDPGVSEKPIPPANIVSANVSYGLTDTMRLALVGSNLADDEYFRSADEKAPLAVERSVGLQFRWQSASPP